MRIICRIATDAKDGIVRFPVITKNIEDCVDPKTGCVDHAKAQSVLMEADRSSPGTIQLCSSESANVLAFAMDYLLYAHEWMKQIVRECGSGASITPETERPMTRADKRMAAGKVAYARTHITERDGGREILVRVEYANPKNCVGMTEVDAHLTAVMNLQVAMNVAAEWNKAQSIVKVVIDDHERCPGLVAEAFVDYRERENRAKYKSCPNRKSGGGYTICTPIKTDCPFNKNGGCIYGK